MRPIIRNTTLLILFLALSPITYAQQQWKKMAMEMQTRWAKDVSPEHTLEDYPRPQLSRPQWTNLNGLWDYAITAQTDILPLNFDGRILVPYPLESALSGVKKSLRPDQLLWYRRTIDRPQLGTGERVLLNFGAVDWQATVYVNGKAIGRHSGGYQSFSFDITSFLKNGKNELLIKVYDPSDRGIGPHGKQVLNPANIYYTPSSGIWQTVWLETVPETYVESLHITPDLDKKTVLIKPKINQNEKRHSVEVIAKANGKTVQRAVVNGDQGISLSIANPHTWSPDDPFLYDLVVRVLSGGKVIDEVKSYFGMRKISIGKDEKGIDRILLNNKYTFNLGVLDQGFWPDGLYTAPTDEALQFDIKAIKAMGFNTIRKHIKVEPARWYYYADKLGMLVWQDFVNPNQGLPAGAKEEFEREMKETMNQLHNYPSIATWVLFNERWGQFDQERLTKWVKQYDPTRMVNGHSGELLYVNGKLRDTTDVPYINSDLTDVHSYPDPRNPIKLPGKAMVLGEFGGVGVSVPGHQWNDLQGWGYIQETPERLVTKYDSLMQQVKALESKGLSGSIYTQPFDVEGEENGLMTYDREVIKIPLSRLRKINASLVANRLSESNPDFHIAQDIDVHDTDDRYDEFLSDYKKGNRDSAFLRRLILISLRKRDTASTRKISQTYINGLSNIYTKSNLSFIWFITASSKDRGFEIFNTQKERVNAILGSYAAEKKIKEIIAKEEIDPYITSSTKVPDWDAIQKNTTLKYGPLGEEYVIGRRMRYYWLQSKDWDNLGKYYVLYFQRALSHSEYHINNVSWQVFKTVNDPNVLNFAVKVMKYSLDNYDQDNTEAYDTYANLLYKAGKKEEALIWEEKAVKMSDNAPVYKETYDKMKKGIPTWPQKVDSQRQ